MSEHPFARFISALHRRGCLQARGCYVRAGTARATCPIHRDTKPSLGVRTRGNAVDFNCFFCGKAGKPAILQTLGLKEADLFSGPPPVASARPHIVAIYDYGGGGQKVRYDNKDFAWRVYRGGAVGLYRLPELADTAVIYLAEGEKSVDYLWSLRLPSTCGPHGAGTWKREWSLDLWRCGCRQLVIFIDHDAAGMRHGELVATITHALEDVDGEPIAVKVVNLPGLADKADVYDWLQDHCADELMAVVAATPVWTPALAEQLREKRKRDLRAARNRAWRKREAAKRAETLRMSGGAMRDAANVQLEARDAANVRSRDARQPRRCDDFVKVVSRERLTHRDGCERSSSTLQRVSIEHSTGGDSQTGELEPGCDHRSDDAPGLPPTGTPDSPPPLESPAAFTSARLERFKRRLSEDAAARGFPL